MIKDAVLNYKNNKVVERYAKIYNKDDAYSHDVFHQLLKWLYICHACSLKKISATVTKDIVEIDNMWHTFLLFTKEYSHFCDTYFNQFIHHLPSMEELTDEEELEKKKQLKKQLIITIEAFGAETFTSWYKEKQYA